MSPALLPATVTALERFRVRRTRLLRLRALLTAGAVLLGLLLLVALVDRATFMPDGLRLGLSIVAYVAAIIAAWRLGLRYISEARGERGAARLLEKADPSLRERLLSAVELAHGGEDVPLDGSPEFRARLQEDVAAQLDGFDARKALPARLLKSALLAAGAVAALLMALGFLPGLHLPGFMARAALPFVNLPRPSSTKIHVVNPAKIVTLAPIASTVPLTVDLEGKPARHVVVETRGDGMPTLRSELSAASSSRFEGGIAVGQGNVRYRIYAGDAVSEWRTLEARPRPAVTRYVKTIVPPAYTGLPEKTVTEDHGDLSALEGSTVKLVLQTNQPIQQAAATLLPAMTKVGVTLDKPNELHARILLDGKADGWQVALTGKETNFNNEESAPSRIETVADLPPTVAITQPSEQLEVRSDDSVQVTGEAADDIGLAKIELSYAINGADWKDNTLLEKVGQNANVSTTFKLAPLPVKTGDAVLVKLAATDLKGQRSESTPVRLLVVEDKLNFAQRDWARQQRDLAKRAMELAEQSRSMQKDAERARANQRKNRKKGDPDEEEAALARLKQNLDATKERTDDLWKELKDAAKNAPDKLAALETELAGRQLAEIRGDHLRAAQEETRTEQTDQQRLREAVVQTMAKSQQLADALRVFAASHTAQAAKENLEHLAPQQNKLADKAIDANRDVATRPKWQEQQHAALDAAKKAREDLRDLQDIAPDHRKRDVDYQVKNLDNKMAALEGSMDRKDQHQAPEFIYGQSQEMRNGVNQARDASRWLADEAMQRANEMRERLMQQQNPALAALDQGRAQAERSVSQKKETPKTESAREKAADKLAAAARQLKDQSELRVQNAQTNSEAALDMNRLGRALDEVKEKIEKADSKQAVQEAVAQAKRLNDAAKVLQADATAHDAAQALAEARESEMSDAQPEAHAAAAQAAANKLKQLPEALRQAQADNQAASAAQEAANNAQWQRDELRNQQNIAAQQRQNGQAPQPPPAKENRALQANDTASKKLDEAIEKFSPKVAEARGALQQLTPKLSELAKHTASELRKSQEQTQKAADAATQKEVAQNAEEASALLPKAGEDAEKLADLQSALRQEADKADLAKEAQRQMARSADVGLEQMRRQAPQIAQNLQQAAKGQQSSQQAQSLNNAAQAQKQTADSVQQLAQNLEKAEQGQMLSDAELAAQQQEEQELDIKKPLDDSYGEAKNLAELMKKAQEDPQAALASLEKELKKNPAMQRALGELAQQTAQDTENQLAMAQQDPQTAPQAAQSSAHHLARVARHEGRLDEPKAAQQIAQASKQLKDLAKQPATDATQSLQKAAEHTQQAQTAASEAAKDKLANTPNPSSFLDVAKGAMLAQALDQLDQSLNPQQLPQNQQAQNQQPNGQQQGQQDNAQQSAQQQAQQNLAQAGKAQAQSMAQARAEGKVPGQTQESQTAQNNAKSGKPQNQRQGQESTDATGNMANSTPNLIVPVLNDARGGDWGHLPSRMARDLTEASRQEPSPEYRAAIESYYKAIAEKARK
jgi:hypothetical protein